MSGARKAHSTSEGGDLRGSDVVLYGSIAVGAVVGFSFTGGAALGTAIGVAVGVVASRALERRQTITGRGPIN